MKFTNFKLAAVLLVGVGVLSVGFPYFVKSFEAENVTIENFYEAAKEAAEESLGGVLEVGERIFTGRVTLDRTAYRGDFKIPLNFSRGASTTPGGLFSILNDTADTRLCRIVEVDVTTSGTVEASNAIAISVATSTTDGAYSTKNGSVIASSTVPTSSTALITNVVRPGSYIGADQDIGGETFVWGEGEYLLGAFDEALLSAGGTSMATSSGAYAGMSGFVYTTCHER